MSLLRWEAFQAGLSAQDSNVVADVYVNLSPASVDFMSVDGLPMQQVQSGSVAHNLPPISQAEIMAVLNGKPTTGQAAMDYLDQDLGKLAKASLP